MFLKVIGRAVWWTLRDLFGFVMAMLCLIGAVLAPMLVTIAILFGLSRIWPPGFAPWLAGMISTGLLLAAMASVFLILYLMWRLPVARQIVKAEKVAIQEGAVPERMRVVLARFHEDCYINDDEFMDDFYMMGRLIDAQEGNA
jgi:hypothetical protein